MAQTIGYGKRLLPHILDDLATTDPDRIIYSSAKSSDISQGFLELSARCFSKAVDKIAWWLQKELGKSPKVRPLGYIGPHDPRHVILTYAACKAGYAALFLSPKNSVEGALAVLDATDCNVWMQPKEQPQLQLVNDVLRQREMKVLQVPEMNELLGKDDTAPFPYDKTFEEASQEPFCVLHTSGSTGLPKPSVWTHALIATTDAVRLLPPTEGDHGMAPWTSGWNEKDRLYSSFPMSHAAGVFMNIVMPAFYGLHCILGPPGVIPNTGLVDSLAEHAKIDIWSMVPSLVDELGEASEVLPKFKKSKFICASGGPTNPASASKVNEVIRVLNITGTTEGLFIGNLWVDREDWLWFAFHPWSGFEFREVEPGVYEHWIRRNEHWSLFQGFFHTFPDKDEINLKDLYIKHPTKPGHFAYKGRSDDVVVLSNGYKISPLDTESSVTANPEVNGCLVIGSGQNQAGLLIEPKDSARRNNEEVIDSIWKTVEEVNETSVHKNQLQKDFIMFADEDKPFVRTDKGTVKRRATLELYRESIQQFYDSRENDAEVKISATVNSSSLESVANAVAEILTTLSPTFQNVDPDTDLFELGLDSLMVFRVIRTIRSLLGLQEELAARHLYLNPTISKFANTLIKIVAKVKNGDTGELEVDEQIKKVQEKLEEYRSDQSLRMNPFDSMTIKIYQKLVFCLPLKPGVSFEQAFSGLQQGLVRLFSLIPALDSKTDIYLGAEGKKGVTQLVPTPTDSSVQPRQLTFNDLSKSVSSYAELQAAGFVGPAFPKDDLILQVPFFPPNPTDTMVARANFIEGGCLLATAFHHSIFDGTGVVTVLRAWAECCRYVQGDESATCSWIDPESMNHSLPQVLWEVEGYARPIEEIDPATWSFVSHSPPEGVLEKQTNVQSRGALPHPPTLPPLRPLPPEKSDRSLQPHIFRISGENVEKLRKDVSADPAAKGLVTSASDMIQALFWRATTKARAHTVNPDEVSVLELPIDCRPFFSSLLPSSYTGNLIVITRPNISIGTICAPETSIGNVALVIRQATACVRPPLVHDVFALLRTLTDYSRHNYAFLNLDGPNFCITNLMLFPTNEISFGGGLFGGNGTPSAVRLLMNEFNTVFRMGVIFPIRDDGSVDLQFVTFPEELEKLKSDEELLRYATYIG